MAEGAFIPGLNNKYNSQEAINKIMEKKRVKLDELEKKSENIKEKKNVLNEIRKKAVSLQQIAKKLYGIDSPFDKKLSQSSNENAFSASVEKNAEIGEYKIEILQKAKAHKIASKSLDKKYKIPAGEYNIMIGEDKIKISFSGGTLDQFAEEIKKDSKDKLKAIVTWDTTKTQVLVLESGKTGEKNYISFIDDKTKNLFKEMDFFEDISTYEKNFKINKNNLTNLSQFKRDPVFNNEESLIVDRQETYKYNLTEKIPYKKQLIMEIDLKLINLDPNKTEEITIPTGPDFSKGGNINAFDIFIEGESTLVDIPKFEKPEKPKIMEDDHYLEIVTDKRTIKLDELDVNTDKKTLKFDLSKFINPDETVEALIFKNNNTYKKLEVGMIKFYDDGARDGIRFKREISKPQNALLVLDGIEIERDTNTINDLIKGITIYVFDKTNKEETLKVDRDYHGMVEAITDFLGQFNEYLTMINNETNSNPDMEGNPGKFSGEYTLVMLASKLRGIMMNPHLTSYGDEIALLAQIGISTNVYGSQGMDKSKLKGILEVNENLFIEKMEKYPIGVKELFGRDNDGDLIIDSGVAFEIETLLRGFTMKGQGFFDSKDKTLDYELEINQTEIKEYEEKLTKEEKKLKEQFFKMEKAANELEENQKKFQNFYKNNN